MSLLCLPSAAVPGGKTAGLARALPGWHPAPRWGSTGTRAWAAPHTVLTEGGLDHDKLEVTRLPT